MSFWQPKNRLTKTGATTSYNPTGRTAEDDGGNNVGADRQFETLTAGQFSGTTTITVNSINDAHTNACVIDKRTGLMWNKEESSSVYGTGAQHLLWDATGEAAGADEEDIFFYCDTANTASLSGFSDWRVPNLREFLSILNLEPPSAFPEPTYFNTVTSGQFWTGTARPNNTTQALAPNVNSLSIGGVAKTTGRYAVMLVRG